MCAKYVVFYVTCLPAFTIINANIKSDVCVVCFCSHTVNVVSVMVCTNV